MLRYSYKTEIERLEADKLKVSMNILKYPNNHKFKEELSKINKDIEWYKNRPDPGTVIL